MEVLRTQEQIVSPMRMRIAAGVAALAMATGLTVAYHTSEAFEQRVDASFESFMPDPRPLFDQSR